MTTETEDQKPPDYLFAITAVVIVCVYLLCLHYRNNSLALSAGICACVMMVTIRMRWNLRSYFWFWATISMVSLLHVLLVLVVPFPHITINRITLLPIAFADYLIYFSTVNLVEKFIAKASPDETV